MWCFFAEYSIQIVWSDLHVNFIKMPKAFLIRHNNRVSACATSVNAPSDVTTQPLDVTATPPRTLQTRSLQSRHRTPRKRCTIVSSESVVETTASSTTQTGFGIIDAKQQHLLPPVGRIGRGSLFRPFGSPPAKMPRLMTSVLDEVDVNNNSRLSSITSTSGSATTAQMSVRKDLTNSAFLNNRMLQLSGSSSLAFDVSSSCDSGRSIGPVNDVMQYSRRCCSHIESNEATSMNLSAVTSLPTSWCRQPEVMSPHSDLSTSGKLRDTFICKTIDIIASSSIGYIFCLIWETNKLRHI